MLTELVAAFVMAQPAPEVRAVMERAAAVVPHPRQVEWQRLEFTMFIHFGVNTFTDREWGTGEEDPKLFNPTELDADQWAQVAVDAGMKAVILVAKHHDGFCLWPSAFTEHSVKNSPWRGGKGDLVREVSLACGKHGLKFGVYLSPADLHEPSYGQSERYNLYFENQLRELLTNYGPICEVWFDGATPKDKGQVYNYAAWYELIRDLQPEATIFGRGPDIRWVGNEAGKTRASEWSVVPLPVPAQEFNWPDMTGKDLGSIAQLWDAKHLHWYPAETDTSIRPGWFWHEKENDKVRSLDDLLDCYYGAVGGNSVLLLNVPPDRRGLIHESDAARLREMGTVLRATFGSVVAGGGASGTRATANIEVEGHIAAAAIDGHPETFWTTQAWEVEPVITISVPEARRFNVVMIQEHIASGQRIERFAVDVWDETRWAVGGSGWREVASGTTVGYKKLLRIPEENTNRVRIRCLESRVRPTIAEIALYSAPVRLPAPAITRDRNGMVTIIGPANGAVCYTTDGSEPRPGVNTYGKPFALERGGTVKAQGIGLGPVLFPGEIATAEFDLAKAKWRVASVSSEQADAGEAATNAIDDDPGTFWHTRYSPDTAKHPHWIVIDLGETVTMKGMTYTARPASSGVNGTVVKYEVYVSRDGEDWGEVAAAGALERRAAEQRVIFGKERAGRYLKFVALSEVHGRDWASAAEVGVVTR
jgi:alpha-L-fucosidase